MKLPLLLSAAVLGWSFTGMAADQSAPAPTAAATAPAGGVPDFSADKTADDLWNHLKAIQDAPKEAAATPEEEQMHAEKWLTTMKAGLVAFVQRYPADPRSWNGRLVIFRADEQLRRLGGDQGTREGDRKRLDEIINAPEAQAQFRAEASYLRVMTFIRDIQPGKPDGFDTFNKEAEAFLAKYEDSPFGSEMKVMQMQILMQDKSPEGDARLRKIAAGSDPRQAASAQAILARRDKMAEWRKKPMELKFTSADGQPVDLASLRGKVVLIDFWASWCPPCIADMPKIAAAYKNLHDKGFEIVGISLDQEKDNMEAAMKKFGMTWVEHFDGDAWESGFVRSFGVTALPASLLIDKKGLLRDYDVHGDELSEGVEKLLAE